MFLQILLPTDFSGNSRVAIDYIIHQNESLNARLILFHAVHLPGGFSLRVDDEIKELLKEEGRHKLAELEKEIRGKHGDAFGISSVCVYNSPVMGIENYCKENKIDLVVIGTTGHTGLGKTIIGSNAAEIVETTHVPVLMVPENVPLKKIEDIAYASDLEDIARELEKLVYLAKMFEAHIHLLHIYSNEKLRRDMLEENTIQEQLQINYYPKLSFEGVENKDVIKGIKNYISKNKVDLLVMYSKERSIFAQMFKRSFTREMVMESTVPMLAYKKKY